MKEINLEEILAKWVSYNLQQFGRSKEASDSVAKTSIEGGAYWYILEAMKESCKQVLELASENAEEYYSKSDEPLDESLKQSILDTINQVK